jgi:hypothetical protein
MWLSTEGEFFDIELHALPYCSLRKCDTLADLIYLLPGTRKCDVKRTVE